MAKVTSAVKTTIAHLTAKGFNAAAAIGVCGNIKRESNFNTAAVGDHGTSFGICQWHDSRGSNMKKYVGSDWENDLTGQLDFLWHELSKSYKGVFNALKKVPNTKGGAKDAAEIFVRKFEKPADIENEVKIRRENAADYWDKTDGAKGIAYDAAQEFIKVAKEHVGKAGHNWVKSMTTIGEQGWCAATMCAVAIETKFAGKIMPKHKYVPQDFCKAIVKDFGGTYIKAYQMGEKNPNVQPGDIAAFQNFKGDDGKHGKTGKYGARHVGVVSKVNKNGTYTIIHGNWKGMYSEDQIKKSKIGWFARPAWDKVGGAYTYTGGGGGGTGGEINLQQAIALLYSSDNYSYIYSDEKKEKSPTQILREAINRTLNKVKEELSNKKRDAKIPGSDTNFFANVESKTFEAKTVNRKRVYSELPFSTILVQAPYIEVIFNGIKVGGYNSNVDKYPNYITSLIVEKINNKINTYTISMVHQVRAGEDPNLIDSILSRTGYRNKVKIKYGDSANGVFYKEEEAYIMDATYNENVASASISYTIKAVSSVNFVKYTYMSYPAVTSKPSTEITKLMYNSGQSSIQLQEALPGMRRKQVVLGKNLIPTNDAVVNIPGLADASPVDRLSQLVANMRDPTDPSGTYMLTFNDATNNASFKIVEVKRQSEEDKNAVIKNCYTIDVGYPGNTLVTSFTINNDVYWPLYYKYAGKVASYNYNIDYSGRIIKSKVNPLDIDDKFQSKNVEKMNWWEYVRSYPITASLTIQGIMKPMMLMENIYIFSQMYGQQDLATGLYSIIGQTDNIGGGGCTTTLELLKIG